MMVLISALLGGTGIICLLYRKSFLGFLIGTQLLVLGASSMIVSIGVSSKVIDQGYLFGFFIVLGSVAQLIIGFALAVRLFYLKNRTGMDELRSLKH
ncbi:MAG: NADH-quinone oxidoreductase subunit K [Methylotenera sp.]|nr:NADH-quinone oxidoreductase subunit K [Oligoflexia bacterium]